MNGKAGDKILDSDIQKLIERYPEEPRFALAAMQDMQREYGYVPREGLTALSSRVGKKQAQMFALATFYKALSIEPKGKHIIKLCDGTACHIRGSNGLIGAVKRILGIEPGETTADSEFSLELVNCLGSCALAPVMVVDDIYYGKVTPDALADIFERHKNAAAGKEEPGI